MGTVLLFLAGGAVAIAAAALGLQMVIREYGRRHPDPAWKPTGYRFRS